MWKFDAVVVSDLHLGARNARTQEFLHFLESLETDRLILAGDVFENPKLRGLKPSHVKVVQALRDFALGTRVVWLRGNHDPTPEWFRGLLGIQALGELVLDVAGKNYLVAHGQEWDAALQLPWLLIATADAIYRASQWLDPTHRLARQLKRKSKYFCKSIDQLRRKAVAEARSRALAGVILGHAHVAGESRIEGMHYLNCGCWTERPSGFVGIRDGQVRLYYWDFLVRHHSVPAQTSGRSRAGLVLS